MPTQCIDISADKNISNASPFAMGAFMVCYVITNLLMKASFIYFILLIVEFIICQVLFQFSPRVVFLSIRFLTMQKYQTPTHEDLKYYPMEQDLSNLQPILEYKEIKEENKYE
jgi:hypothetical protein